MKSIIVRLFFAVVKISLLSTIAQANITVTNLADTGPGSLRQAIVDATQGEIIDFSVTGTITLTTGQLSIDKNLTIRGSGATNLTISGNNSSRVFNIQHSAGNVVISGLTIANGNSGYGGGIYNDASLLLAECVVQNCYSGGGSEGGGIYNANAGRILTLSQCTITGNIATGGGGGIFNYGGSVLATNCTISSNKGSNGGGGIFNYGRPDYGVPGITILKSCTITSNVSLNAGGTVYGGGIALNGGTVTIQNSIIAGNSADVGPDCDNTTWSYWGGV